MTNWYLSETTYELYRRIQHWYGEIGRDDRDDDEVVQLTRVLSESAAKEMIDADEWKGWRVGDETERFDSREDLRFVALRHFLVNAASGDRLYLGRDWGQVRDLLAVRGGPR